MGLEEEMAPGFKQNHLAQKWECSAFRQFSRITLLLKLGFLPQSFLLSWGHFHRSRSERGCPQWKLLTMTNKHKKTRKTTLYEENNVIRLIDSVFFHKSLEIPPPDKKECETRIRRTMWEGLTYSPPPQWICSHWTRCPGPSSCCTRTALSLALNSWNEIKPSQLQNLHFVHTWLWIRWTCRSLQMSSWEGPQQCWLTFGHLSEKVLNLKLQREKISNL